MSVALDLHFVGSDPYHGGGPFDYWPFGSDEGHYLDGSTYRPYVETQFSGLNGGGYTVPYAGEFIVPAGTTGYLGPLDVFVGELSWYKYQWTEWNYYHGGGGVGNNIYQPNRGYDWIANPYPNEPFQLAPTQWRYPRFWLVDASNMGTVAARGGAMSSNPFVGSTVQPSFGGIASASASMAVSFSPYGSYHGGILLGPGHYLIGAGVGDSTYGLGTGRIGAEFVGGWDPQYFSPWRCAISGSARQPSWDDLGGKPAEDKIICRTGTSGPPGANCPT